MYLFLPPHTLATLLILARKWGTHENFKFSFILHLDLCIVKKFIWVVGEASISFKFSQRECLLVEVSTQHQGPGETIILVGG